MAIYLIIFGAAVRADGSASPSLARRVDGAWRYALAQPGAVRFLATGGVGRHGPAEALVMRDLLLARGCDEQLILLETQAGDTLESVVRCERILAGLTDIELVAVCTSGYHQYRCALLLRLLGYRVALPAMPADRPFLGGFTWGRYVAKECLALPYDVLLLLLFKLGRGLRRR
ncbi:YdcF family protein [Duganella callida]|uniref:YdcF family protein n=1 Tax=Duganella callida TaxID=2561932 RepID=A0A4Y9ST18_9BURK|nr:YdcF family protein [Duganella callida]TFW29942.1 YdcF family protein [Duganella callida]